MDTRKLTSYQHRHAKPVHLAIGDKYEKVATMKTSAEWQDTHIAAELVKRWNAYAELLKIAELTAQWFEDAQPGTEGHRIAEQARVAITNATNTH